MVKSMAPKWQEAYKEIVNKSRESCDSNFLQPIQVLYYFDVYLALFTLYIA